MVQTNQMIGCYFFLVLKTVSVVRGNLKPGVDDKSEHGMTKKWSSAHSYNDPRGEAGLKP